MRTTRKFVSVGVLLAVMGMATPARAATVDLALILATDVSGSVDATDFNLMISGYVNAFNSPSLVNAIQSGAIGQIAVSLVFWSDTAAVGVGWTEISDAASASAFATAVAAAPRPFSGGTGMVNAINFSSGLFASAPEATRQVIDIAGDGAENSAHCAFNVFDCVPLQNARDAFLAGGANRTINALWIADPPFFGGPGNTIDALLYGEHNVIGGPNAFQSLVSGFAEFEGAILDKLEREVRPVPEPATLALMMTAFGAVTLARRRRR